MFAQHCCRLQCFPMSNGIQDNPSRDFGAGIAHAGDLASDCPVQHGLGRFVGILDADGLLRNPLCDARASDGATGQDRVGESRTVRVRHRCDWTFDLNGSCRVTPRPRSEVRALLRSARQVGVGDVGSKRKSEDGKSRPRVDTSRPPDAHENERVGRF